MVKDSNNNLISGLSRMVVIGFALSGCTSQHAVVAATGTTVGLSVTQDPSNQGVQATFGYRRGEFAYVPTNRDDDNKAGGTGGGARDSTDVLMEFGYKTGTVAETNVAPEIFQRLAVGENAVKANGAVFMFARAPDGKVDQNTLQAIQSLPTVDIKNEVDKNRMTQQYFSARSDAAKKAQFDQAAKAVGYDDYGDFSADAKVDQKKIAAVRAILESLGYKF